MDRNREARRASAMAASTNGVSRRRPRTSSLRDSPEEEGGPAEMHEPGRLRDRGAKKDRDRVSRSKRRRHDEESSEGSVSDDADNEDEEGAVRMLPPHPAVSNHGHNQAHSLHVQQHVSRKGYPGSTGVNSKVFKPVQGWKPADEMIGFAVPRKARSASTKRSHENWISSAGATPEQPHRQASPSPSPSTAPLSPSSSNVSVRKKMKPNGGPKQKPLKSSSKASSSNPGELEIEIAEVLYGLMTQSQSPPKREAESSAKFDPNRPNNESKSMVSSPISNSASTAQLPQNSSSSTLPFSAVAPKRKKPRQVSENPRSSPISSTVVKPEIDQQPKAESLLPNTEKNLTNGSENRNFQSLTLDFTSLENPVKDLPALAESPVRNAPVVKQEEIQCDAAVAKVNSTSPEMDTQREEKFEIDLMAPPPQLRSSPERESEIDFAAVKADALKVTQDGEVEKASKSGRDEILVEEPELKKAKSGPESAESDKMVMSKERNIDLQLDLEKPEKTNRDNAAESLSGNNKSHTYVQKQRQPHTDKSVQSSSLSLPMSLASWPGGLPPMGYMAPLQGVVSMDGSHVPPTPVQPRPKRCATHRYIAWNIHCLQQLMKMNPFWPAAAAGSTSLFSAKPSNLNVVPSTELHGRTISSVQDKGQSLAIFPGLVGKEKSSQSSTLVDAQGKQQHILLQQALPPSGAPPSNMLHGPAFIFPFNQQQAAAATAVSVRPGLTKPSNAAPNSSLVTNTSTSSSINGSATTAPTPAAVSFNYPNMPSSETQYLAVLPNNTYPFPVPAPAYRGTHPQAMPLFNGSFYTSQMIHPSQLQQQPSSQPQQKVQPGQQNASISSGSSSSQKKNLQSQQQGPQQGTVTLNPFPAPKTRPAQSSQPHQARNIETEVGNEDSPSTADSRSSRGPMNVYGQNFSMPIHHQSLVNQSLVNSTQALVGTGNGNTSQGENKKQQQSQQQSLKTAGVEPLPQSFAVSFASMNGGSTAPGGIDLSSVAQNHTVYQKFSDADNRSYHIKQAAVVAQAAQQRKNLRVSEENKNGVGGDSQKMEEEKKGLAPKVSVSGGQSIAFARSDLTDPSVSPLVGTNVIDSSARNLNLASSANNQHGSRSSLSNNSQHGQLQNVQHIQPQMVQVQKQQQQLHQQQLQQQFSASRNNKAQPMSNGCVYSDHLATSSTSAGSNFPNTISGYPQNLVQSGSNNSPTQSPQWKSSTRTASQVQPSSMKNLPQQQQARLQQSHTQISFGSSEKSQTGPHGQQSPSTHQSSSPPIGVGSPTNSLSKGAGGSPRTQSSNSQGNKSSSLSSQHSKNPALVPNLKTPSILGNPHNIASSNSATKSLVQPQQQRQHLKQQQQQQLTQMVNHQPQLFFSPAYMHPQPPQSNSNTNNTTSGYYLQRLYPDKQQQQQGGSPSRTSAGMLSLCTPVTLASSSATEAKAASQCTKGPLQGILHQPQFQVQSSGSFSYTHTVPAGVQVKMTKEQKQPAGNRELLTRK